MKLGRRSKFTGLIGLIFIALILLGGWWWFFTGDVETVLSTREFLRGGWSLSPGGDKILYRSEARNVLMLLPTKQKRNIENCGNPTWLDNTNLVCSSYIIDTDDMVKVSIQHAEASEVNLDALLPEAGTIYKLEQYSDIVLLSANYKQNPDKNYRIDVKIEDSDQVLQGHSYISVPSDCIRGWGGDRIYSPDRAYYYQVEGDWEEESVIAIYDAINDKQLSRTHSNRAVHRFEYSV